MITSFQNGGLKMCGFCGTDTNSLILAIRTEDLVQDVLPDIQERFNTSKFKRTDFDGTIIPKINRKVLGKMKNELAGQFMTQFAATGPKSYAYEYLKLDGKLGEDS